MKISAKAWGILGEVLQEEGDHVRAAVAYARSARAHARSALWWAKTSLIFAGISVLAILARLVLAVCAS